MDLAPTPAARVIAAGTTIERRYRLITRLGVGGTADVWQAADERLHRHVALKLFRPDTADPARERAELAVLARLSHPGLVAVFDAGVDEHPFTGRRGYLVMEFVDGRTLRQHLSDGPLAPAFVARLGVQLSLALAYVHSRGIIHRDMKPANILVRSGTGTVKLTDFGVARSLDAARITAAGCIVGTAHYVSPEQLRGAQLTPASDVYSLALVLLEALGGTSARPGSGVEVALDRLARPPQIPMHWGGAWHALLSRALATDPLERPAAAELAAVLNALATAPEPVYESPVLESAEADDDLWPDDVVPLSIGHWQVPPERRRRSGPRRTGRRRRRQAA